MAEDKGESPDDPAARAAGKPDAATPDRTPEVARETYQIARQRGQEWEREVESVIKDRPIPSILVAGAVGFVVGLLWSRR